MKAIVEELRERGVTVKTKDQSLLMRLISVVLGLFGLDFNRFWTTIGPCTIYAPVGTRLTASELERQRVIIEHELVHIGQARRWPGWFQLSYLLFPLPVGLAYFRWVWERRAYLVDIRAGRLSIEEVVDTLWANYGWCWPRPLMRCWFGREVSR